MRVILLTLFFGATRGFVVSPPSALHQQPATASSSSLFDLNDRLAEQMGVPEVHSDSEWHPRDPANTVPQLMSSIWHQINHAGNMKKGVRDNFTLLRGAMFT
jgi:hypothetical protein